MKNGDFKIRIKESSLPEKEKKKLLFEVFDILLGQKENKKFNNQTSENNKIYGKKLQGI